MCENLGRSPFEIEKKIEKLSVICKIEKNQTEGNKIQTKGNMEYRSIL